MKIQYCSDLHMEFHENMRFMKSQSLEPVDMIIGDTHLVSNPLGYVFCGENANFNDSAVIEV